MWKPSALKQDVFDFVRLLKAGHSLGQAVEKICEEKADFRLPEALGLIFTSRLITEISNGRIIT